MSHTPQCGEGVLGAEAHKVGHDFRFHLGLHLVYAAYEVDVGQCWRAVLEAARTTLDPASHRLHNQAGLRPTTVTV